MPACPRCHADNRQGAHFCDTCGSALATPTPTQEAGERKYVTVMFVDIVRSMDHALEVDPERWHEFLEDFYGAASVAVQRLEGTMDKFTGDGIMALFGAPIAHEDHAVRACRAAIELHAAMGPLAASFADTGRELAVRVGVNSGEVIVGEIGDAERMAYTAFGHAVGIAQRMESVAPPGSTALSAATARLVAGALEVRPLGDFVVKGSEESQPVFELVGAPRGHRFASADGGPQGLSRLVGRERERAALESALKRALDGDGQVVGIVGEPGMGKSRLVHVIAAAVAARGVAVLGASAPSHGRRLPLLPVLELMRAFLGIAEDQEPAVARAAVAERLAGLDTQLMPELPLLLDFLGIAESGVALPTIDADARQRRLLALVRRMVRARSRQEPALIVVEDLHWLDDASGAFLSELVRAVAGTRTLLLATYRPEYDGAVLQGSHCEQVALRPLPVDAVESLLRELLGCDPSLRAAVDLVASRTRGNPFFCEEIVQELRETGYLGGARGAHRLVREIDADLLPASVQAALAARVDRLDPSLKALVQDAAVVGPDFSTDLLAVVTGLDAGALEDRLEQLVAAEILTRGVDTDFAFKHPLTRDVAYRSQLRAARQSAHARTVRALEAVHAGALEQHAALLAHHAAEAGDSAAAASWHLRAGLWVGQTDPDGAIGHFREARDLANRLPEGAERAGLALGARGGILRLGWRVGAEGEEVEEAFQGALALVPAGAEGDIVRTMVRLGYAASHVITGRTTRGIELIDAWLPEIEASSDPLLQIVVAAGTTYAYTVGGRLREAERIGAEAVEAAAGNVELGAGLVFELPYLQTLFQLGRVRVMLGQFELGMRDLERAIALADRPDAPETLFYALTIRGIMREILGEPAGSAEDAQRATEVSRRAGSLLMVRLADYAATSAALAQADWEGAESIARRVLAELTTAPGPELRSAFEHRLARTLHVQGRLDEAVGWARASREHGAAQGDVLEELPSCIELGHVLADRGGPGDLDEAVDALGCAETIVARTGIVVYEPRREAASAALCRRA